MRRLASIALMAASLSFASHAADLFDTGKPIAFSQGMPIPSSTTLGGYPLYPGFGSWHLFKLEAQDSGAQGDAESIRMGLAGMEDYDNQGNWRATMFVVANLGTAPGHNQYWSGSPCNGTHLLTINKGSGYTDSCLTVNAQEGRGKNAAPHLEIKATQGASSGRRLVVYLYVNPSAFDVPGQTLQDWTDQGVEAHPQRRDFMQRLRPWAEAFLDATHRAIAFSKPQDAFDKVPMLLQLMPPTPAANVVLSTQ
ncbi:MAG: hypothetical protein ACT4NV_06370 [Rhodoferax sp.]